MLGFLSKCACLKPSSSFWSRGRGNAWFAVVFRTPEESHNFIRLKVFSYSGNVLNILFRPRILRLLFWHSKFYSIHFGYTYNCWFVNLLSVVPNSLYGRCCLQYLHCFFPFLWKSNYVKISEIIDKSSSNGEKHLSQCPALLRNSGQWGGLEWRAHQWFG